MRCRSKYGAKKVTVNGITFDSRKEANRYTELVLLERAGKISGLERQVKFELIPSQRVDGKVVERACHYVADFVYMENGTKVVEDVKGYKTPEYIMKRKLLLKEYGIQVKET